MGKYTIITLGGVAGFIIILFFDIPLWFPHVDNTILVVSLGAILFAIIGRTISWTQQRKRGGQMKVIQTTPATMPVFSTRPKHTSEDMPKFEFVKDPRIVVDSSVILDVIGLNQDNTAIQRRAIAFLEKNKDRIAVLDTVQDEVVRILFFRVGTSEMYEKMKIFENKTVRTHENMLEKIEKIQLDACHEKNINTSKHWLQSKTPYLRKAFGKSFDVTSNNKSERKKWLLKLYYEADSDRRIMAQAMALAEKEDVILLSNDGDITTFESECNRCVAHKLQIGDCYRLPEIE